MTCVQPQKGDDIRRRGKRPRASGLEKEGGNHLEDWKSRLGCGDLSLLFSAGADAPSLCSIDCFYRLFYMLIRNVGTWYNC